MKILIGAAAVSVIVLTGYVIGGDAHSAKMQKRQAFHAECNRIVALKGDLSGLDAKQVAHVRRMAGDCLEYHRTEYYPHERWDRR